MNNAQQLPGCNYSRPFFNVIFVHQLLSSGQYFVNYSNTELQSI